MNVRIMHHQYAAKGGMESYLHALLQGFVAAHDHVDLHVYRCDPQLPLPAGVTLQQHALAWWPRRLRPFRFATQMERYLTRANAAVSLSLLPVEQVDILINGGIRSAFLQQFPSARKPIFDSLLIRKERAAFASCRKIIAHSRLLATEISDYYDIPPNKIQVIYPPLGEIFFQALPHRQVARQALGIAPDKIALLFPSTGHARKGLAQVIAALDAMAAPAYELLVAGSELSAQYHRPYVRSLGFVADMVSLYRAVDCTILPSYYEPFGLVIAESLQCETPVIVSARVGAAELLTAAEGVVLPDFSLEAIIAAIRNIATLHVAPGFAQRTKLNTVAHIQHIKALV